MLTSIFGRKSANIGSGKSTSSAPTLSGEMYTQDGDYIKDIEINDLRNKYLLTKGATQKMVNTARFIDLLILSGHLVAIPLICCIFSYIDAITATAASLDCHFLVSQFFFSAQGFKLN